MAKRKRKKGPGGAFGNQGRKAGSPSSPGKHAPGKGLDFESFAREKDQVMGVISRTLAEQQFRDVQEMKAFLNAHLTGKSFDEILALDRIDPDSPQGRARVELGKIHPSQEPAVRRRHAKLALEHDPENLEAWHELASTYTSPRKFEETCRKAIEIGRRTLADRIRTAERDGLGLWGFTECRPFLSACGSLADLWNQEGRFDEAAALYEEMLRWNPGDNHGVRFSLLGIRLRQLDTAAAGTLLESFPDDDSIAWMYGRAMLGFSEAAKGFVEDHAAGLIVEGAVGASTTTAFKEPTNLLFKAVREYPAGPMFLLDRRCGTGRRLPMVRLGEASEAYDLARETADLWSSPLAGVWLAMVARGIYEQLETDPSLDQTELGRLHDYVESLEFPPGTDAKEREFAETASRFRHMALHAGTPEATSDRDLPFPDAAPEDTAYQLRVSLDGIRPEIWRRLLLPRDVTLEELHGVLQAAMGWKDAHPHQFVHGNQVYRPAEPDDDPSSGAVKDSESTFLGELVERKGDRLRYDYGSGDGWTHTVTVERILAGDQVPAGDGAVCLEGARACPPEDCGGGPGYAHLLAAAADPKHPDHTDALERLGEDFDPESFAPAAVSEALGDLLGSW